MSDSNSSAPEQITDAAGVAEASLEVKQVKPIDADTPEQIIAKLRKELEAEQTSRAAAQRDVKDVLALKDRAEEAKQAMERSLMAASKRIGEISAERETWKAKAKRLETQVDGQKAERLVAMIDERQRLRTDLGSRDKHIAEIMRELGAAQNQAEASRQLARQAEQRFQGLEATAQAMQVARDKAQQERGEAIQELTAAKAKLVKAELEILNLCKRVVELDATRAAKVPVPASKSA